MSMLTKDKYLDDHEVSELRRVLNLARKRNERDVLIIELALSIGARESEILDIGKPDIDPGSRSILIRGLKGSNDRDVPIMDDALFDRLWSYAKDIDGKLFPISDSRVRQIWGEMRPMKKKFHALRHTFARMIYEKKKDLRLVQYLLGHKSITSTMIYTQIEYSPEKIREALA